MVIILKLQMSVYLIYFKIILKFKMNCIILFKSSQFVIFCFIINIEIVYSPAFFTVLSHFSPIQGVLSM